MGPTGPPRASPPPGGATPNHGESPSNRFDVSARPIANAGPSTRSSPDPLAAVIALLRPQTVLSKVVSGAGRWSVRYGAHQDPGFCLILEGSCFLDAGQASPVELREGDFVLLPATPGFTLASDLAMRPTLMAPVHTRELRHGTRSGPPTMRMLGGYFRFDRANAEFLVRLLPAIVHIERAQPGSDRLRRLAELIEDEAGAKRPGGDVVLERLVEVLLIEALRFASLSTRVQDRGLLAGLAHPALARVLHEVHAEVARRWTVAQLGRVAGMSRAVFAERFSRTIGIPPMQYILEWRIAVAKEMLRREDPPLAEVAERVGYKSASAFSTAFTRLTGCSPSAFAKRRD